MFYSDNYKPHYRESPGMEMKEFCPSAAEYPVVGDIFYGPIKAGRLIGDDWE